ncbi:MAG: DUF3987 domain-containing protein [Phycisphaerae bacterium]
MAVQLQFKPRGSDGEGTITATANNEVIHSDAGDIHDADFRRSFVRALCRKCQALDSDDLDSELIRLAQRSVSRVGKRASIAHHTLMPLPDYETFPVDALPPVIRKFVRKAAAAIGCDASYVALPLMSTIASAIGNTRRIKLKESWSEPSVLWTAIIGESGTRKSPAIELVTSPVIRRQEKAMKAYELVLRDFKVAESRYKEKIKKWKNKKTTGNPPEKPQAPDPDLPTLRVAPAG